jgi:hypothetical protein
LGQLGRQGSAWTTNHKGAAPQSDLEFAKIFVLHKPAYYHFFSGCEGVLEKIKVNLDK